GIWVRGSAEFPLRRYPRTDEGWSSAWMEFRELEPYPVRLTRGIPRPEAEPERPPEEHLEPGETSAVVARPARRLWAALLDAVVPLAMNVVPGLGLLAYGLILFDPLRQGLHDKAAGTVVVSLENVRVGPAP